MAMAKKLTLEPIYAHPEFKAGSARISTLQIGRTAFEQELTALRTEQMLPKLSEKSERGKFLKAQLAAHRAKVRKEPPPAPPEGIPPAVHAALEILAAGKTTAEMVRTARTKDDVSTLITHIIADIAVIDAGIMAQTAVIDELRDRLSFEAARRVQAEHKALVLAQYRAAQQLSAATTAEQTFHRAFTEAGYTWRSDIMPAPAMRSALVLGDESVHDSEISRVRRIMEEMKLL